CAARSDQPAPPRASATTRRTCCSTTGRGRRRWATATTTSTATICGGRSKTWSTSCWRRRARWWPNRSAKWGRRNQPDRQTHTRGLAAPQSRAMLAKSDWHALAMERTDATVWRMVDPDSVIERAQAKLAELRQERQRLEDRRTKIEQDLARIAVAEATLAEMLGEKSSTVIPTTAGGSVTARTKARLDRLHEILKSARHPMTPRDLMVALQQQLGKDAGSRAALQDLL